MLLHTDGLVEQRGHPIDDGLALAADTVAKHATSPLTDLCDAHLTERHDGGLQDDVVLQAARLIP